MDEFSSDNEFRQVLDYIYSFIDYSRQKNEDAASGHFTLSQMRNFMSLLGNPESKLKIIHIAGTKGKGSTASMIAQILRCNGFKVGLFTSPHLQDFTERFQINGNPISHEKLIEIVNQLRPVLDKVGRITWFEITTGIAFYFFEKEKVDFAVMEVGLGGRLDATNVAVPLMSVITSISLDHMKTLGDTIELIAMEKGGIIKHDVPVVVADQAYNAARDVLLKIANERQSPLYLARDFVHIVSLFSSHESQTFTATWQDTDHELISQQFSLSLLGGYQLENAATVLTVIVLMQRMGIKIGMESIQQGFKTVFWPARFEILNRHPLVIIDSAHNPYSIGRLMDSVIELYPDKKVVGLFGASTDKDVRGMLEKFLPRCSLFYASRSIHPRSSLPEDLIEIAKSMGYNGVAIIPIEDALRAAYTACDDDSLLLATGSVFLSAAVRNVWHHNYHVLPDFER